MNGYFVVIWYWTTDRKDPHILLGEPLRSGLNRSLLWNPIQGPPGGHPGRSPLPHHNQYGGGRSDFLLGCAGCGRVSGTRRVRTGGPISGGVFLCLRWYPCLYPTSPPEGGYGYLYGYILKGWDTDQHQQDGGDGMPAMLHGWRTPGGGICE